MPRAYSSPRKQAGTVLVMVVLISAFVVVLVVESVKTVRLQKQMSSNLINRDQAFSYLIGMEEVAKIWLKRAFDTDNEEIVHLNQLWAQDDITFPLEGGLMTAKVKDLQSCFNLNSLAVLDSNSGGNDPGQGSNLDPNVTPTVGQEILADLINQVNESSDLRPEALATAARDWIDQDIEPAGPDGAEDDYYQSLDIPYRTPNGPISHSSELRTVRDFSANLYNQIQPHVCVLPDENVIAINVNTIPEDSAPLLHAVLDAKRSITLDDIKSAINGRGEEGYQDVQEFLDAFGDNQNRVSKKNIDRLTVTSEYFELDAKAQIGNTRIDMKTLFKRGENNRFEVLSRYIGKE